jgi:hypothetical protein
LQPVAIRYTCHRCGVERAVGVPLKEIIHADYRAPTICPLCAARVS